MRQRTLFMGLGVAVVALAVAQAGKQKDEPHFADPAGKFRIDGVRSPEFNYNAKTGVTDFDVSGTPLSGFSKDQGLVFRANHAVGQFTKADKNFLLQKMTITGDVWLQITKDDPKAKTSNVIEVTSQELRVVGGKEPATVTSPGAVKVVSNGAGKGKRLLELNGPNAVLTLDPLSEKSDDPVRKVVMTGSVTVDVDSLSVDKDGKENRVVMHAVGDRMDYDRATREVVLSGHVKLTGTGSGSDPGSEIMGNLEVNEMRLKLDKANEVISYSLGKGKGTFKEGG